MMPWLIAAELLVNGDRSPVNVAEPRLEVKIINGFNMI